MKGISTAAVAAVFFVGGAFASIVDKTGVWKFDVGADGTATNLKPNVVTNFCDLVIPTTVRDGADKAYTVTSIGEEAFTSASWYSWGDDDDAYESPLYGEISSVVIPASVTNIGQYAFRDVPSLTNVVILSDTVTIGPQTFEACDRLVSVVLPENVTLGGFAFHGCTSLTTAVTPYIYDPSKDSSYQPFAGTVNLKHVTLPEGITSIRKSAFEKVPLESVVIPSTVTNIGDWAFLGCKSLASVTIPSSVTRIGRTAFGDCTKFVSVTIPSSVTELGDWAFSGCENLTSLELPPNLTVIRQGLLAGCYALTSVTIPAGVTSIECAAFRTCESLTSVSLPEGLTNLEDSVLAYCTALTEIRIPSTVTKLDGNSSHESTYGHFGGCTNLKKIYISDRMAIPGWTRDNIIEWLTYNCPSAEVVVESDDPGDDPGPQGDVPSVDDVTVTFDKAEVKVKEDAGLVKLTLKRMGNKKGSVGVRYTTLYGTAMPGEDYDSKKGVVVWADGDTKAKTIEITLIPDLVPTWEGEPKNFFVRLENLAFGDADAAVASPRLGALAQMKVTLQETAKMQTGTLQFCGWGTDRTAFANPKKPAATCADGEALTLWVDRVGGGDGAVGARVTLKAPKALKRADEVRTLVWWHGEMTAQRVAFEDCAVGSTATLTLLKKGELEGVPYVAKLGAAKTVALQAPHDNPPVVDPPIVDPPDEPIAAADLTFYQGVKVDLALGAEDCVTNAIGAMTDGITYALAGGKLPAGLKLDAKTGVLSGVPTAAGDAHVVLQARAGKTAGASCALTFRVVGLGSLGGKTFSGSAEAELYGFEGPANEWLGHLTLTVGKTGALSAKVLAGGKTFTFKDTGFNARTNVVELEGEFLTATLRAPQKLGKTTVTNELTVYVPCADGEEILTSAMAAAQLHFREGEEACGYYADLFGDFRKERVWKNQKPTEGYYTMALSTWLGALYGMPDGYGFLTMTIDKNENVKFAGQLADGTAVSGSSFVGYGEEGRPIVVYCAKARTAVGGTLRLRGLDGAPEGRFISNGPDLRWANGDPKSMYQMNPNGFHQQVETLGGYYNRTSNLQRYYRDTLLSLSCRPAADDRWSEKVVPKGMSTWISDPDYESTAVSVIGNKMSVEKQVLAKDSANKSLVDVVNSVNARGMAINYTRATGLFKGNFTEWFDNRYLVSDRVKPKQTKVKFDYAGVMVMIQGDGWRNAILPKHAGYGFTKFTIPREDGKSKWTGSWDLTLETEDVSEENQERWRSEEGEAEDI